MPTKEGNSDTKIQHRFPFDVEVARRLPPRRSTLEEGDLKIPYEMYRRPPAPGTRATYEEQLQNNNVSNSACTGLIGTFRRQKNTTLFPPSLVYLLTIWIFTISSFSEFLLSFNRTKFEQLSVTTNLLTISPVYRNCSNKWTSDQLNLLLLSCGDVESNPGPQPQLDLNLPHVTVFQLNCRSVEQDNKRIEVEQLIKNSKADIVFLEETWLTSRSKNWIVPGYTIFRKDRSTISPGTNRVKTGGGLITMIRDCADIGIHGVVDAINLPDDEHSEILQVQISWKDMHRITLSNLYLPPGYVVNTNTLLTSVMACNPMGEHIIGADYNGHHQLWDSRTPEDQRGASLAEWLLVDSTLSIANKENSYTRICGTRAMKKSSPDISLTSLGLVVTSWELGNRNSSDHLPIVFYVDVANSGDHERPRTKNRETKYQQNIPPDDWKEFNTTVSKYIAEHPIERANMDGKTYASQIAERLQTAVMRGSKKLKQGCYKDPVPWWSDSIDEAIRERDSLEANAQVCGESHTLWQCARRKVLTTITECRQEWWREHCSSDLNYSTDPAKTTKAIRVINRDQRPASNLIIKTEKGVELTTDAKKARGFQNHFASSARKLHFPSFQPNHALAIIPPSERELINALDMEDADRMTNWEREKVQWNKNIHKEDTEAKLAIEEYLRRQASPKDLQYASPFCMVELDSSIRHSRVQSSAGDNRIINRMIQALDATNKSSLLEVINASWLEGHVPKEWLSGTIIPIPKPDKDPSLVPSYRPIVLTCCIAKIAERCVCTRLMFFLESEKKLASTQSGFRVARSTTEPLLRLTNDVYSGFQKRDLTLAVLVDLQDAFVKVDHGILLKAMVDMGVPQLIIKWIRAFIRDRRYHVKVGLTMTKTAVRFETGVPQGSVCGPILYLIYSNSLLTALSRTGVEHAALADDLTIWKSGRTVASVTADIQGALDETTRWTVQRRMIISLKKSEGIVFTNDISLPPPTNFTLGGGILPFKDVVKLLGVQLDSKLTFNAHVNTRLKAGFLRLHQMSQISHSTWGPSAQDMRALYLAYVRSCYLYCAAVFYPFLSTTLKNALQSQQQKAICLITGAISTTPATSAHLEANVLPLEKVATIQLVAVVEKCKRLPTDDPLFQLVTGRTFNIRRVMQHRAPGGWQGKADDVLRDEFDITPNRYGSKRSAPIKLQLRRAPLLITPLTKPFELSRASLVEFRLTLDEHCPKSLPPGQKRRIAENTLEALGRFTIQLWSDGSVQEDPTSKKVAGVGAAHIYDDSRQSRHPVLRSSKVAGFLASSFTAEGVGILVGLQELATYDLSTHQHPTLLICSDCLSQLSALSQGPLAQKTYLNSDIWLNCLSLVRADRFSKIVFQFVPSHCGLTRNEAIDGYVQAAFDTLLPNQHTAQTPLSTIKAYMSSHARIHYQEDAKKAIADSTSGATVYRTAAFQRNNPVPWTNLTISRNLSRADATLLTQLRCGWCINMGPLWHKMNPASSNPGKTCRWCSNAPETINHLFAECKARCIVEIKTQLKLRNTKSLGSEEVEELKKCAEFARRALRALQQEQ